MTGPLGDVGGRHPGVQPQRHGGVPQVVRAASEGRGDPVQRQRQGTGLLPDPRVRRRADHVAVRAAEQPALLVDAETLDVLPQQSDQLGRSRHTARISLAAVLQPAIVVNLAAVGVPLACGSMAAARGEDRDSVRSFLNGADDAARRLGRDGNHLWTAFGPTNVSIHRVATAMDLGDVQVALDLGPRVDTTALPLERQVRHALETARALSARNRTEDALATLLEAERKAPEQVRHHAISRQLVQTWMRRGRGRPSYQLAGLAQRVRVAA